MAKILIADDDLYLRELYEEVLKDAGYEVETAADGEEGLQKIKTGTFDLALLDVMMPKLDGLGILSQITQDSTIVKKPAVILLTNLSQDSAVKDSLSKGAKEVLSKADLTPNQIVEAVKKYISG